MKIGKNKSKELGCYYQGKSQKSIEHALLTIKSSPLANYVDKIYLYGSCARGEQTKDSDVDLLLQLKPDTPNLKEDILDLIGRAVPANIELPEIDLKVVIGDEWREKNSLYFNNIKREGILLC